MTGGRKCSLACWCGLESQQPTWPHVRHIRRCAHVFSPRSAHSWHTDCRCGSSARRPRRCSQPRTGGAVCWPCDSTVSPARGVIGSGMLRGISCAWCPRIGPPIGAEVSTAWLPNCWRCWWCRCCCAALARRFDVSSPLALVVAGLVGGPDPRVHPDIELDPELVLFVLLPPLLWSAGLESSYVELRKNIAADRAAGGGAAAGDDVRGRLRGVQDGARADPGRRRSTLGAIVAPPDAVSATAIGRRLGLPRQIMTLLGGESLLNDATALTAYKVALAAAIGTAPAGAAGWRLRAGRRSAASRSAWCWAWRSRSSAWRLDDPLAESAVGSDGAVRDLPGRRGGARLGCARRRGRGADPRPAVLPRRLRHPAAGRRGVEGPAAGAGVVRVPDDRPAAAAGDRRDCAASPRQVLLSRRSRCWRP